MISIPTNSSNIFPIIGLDPGSNSFGIALLYVDIYTMKIISSNAWTIFGERLAGKNNWIEEIHGGRTNRIMAIEDNLLAVFKYYNPFLIASESPFINNAFPQAGIALTEVMSSIRRAVMRYDPWKELYLISPSEMKQAVGASSSKIDKSKLKDKVKDKIVSLTDLNYSGFVPITELDEHSIDALGVAYARFKTLTS